MQHLFPPTPLLMYFLCYIHFAYFPLPRAGFVVGIRCLVDREQRSPATFAVVFLQLYKDSVSLVLLCDLLLIFLHYCVIMLIQIYANIA